VSCAPAPEGVPALVRRCQDAWWRAVVFSTPTGTRFIDLGELEQLTGEPVRSEYRLPGTGKAAPTADAVLACPLTFNSVTKFAHGHADNFAAGLLCEMAGYGVPVVIVPHCKPQLASHPAFVASLETLGHMGIGVLFDPDARTSRGCCSGVRLSPRSLPVYGPGDVMDLETPGQRMRGHRRSSSLCLAQMNSAAGRRPRARRQP